MRTLGVGSRFSVLTVGIALLAGASACSARETGTESEVSASDVERATGPEQVVQNIKGKGPRTMRGSETSNPDTSNPETSSPEASRAVAREARASAAGVGRSSGASLAPRANPAETITSKHLEAELNRLEAELAN